GNDPLARAEALLESREPLAALVELDRLADSPRAQDAEVQIVRGKAEHALGQLGPAFADFAAAVKQDPRALDDGAISALAELLDPRISCAARRSAVRRLAVAAGSEAEALLARAAEARACGSAEARDALRRRPGAKVAER